MTPPDRIVASRDGTPIAVFESGEATPGTRPLVLVHGTTADHLTFRVVGPLLAVRRRLYAMDRRGRGASGDTPDYAIEREFEDVVAVCEAVAADTGTDGTDGAGADVGGGVDVVGHSFGGRCALGASLRTTAIRRIVSYEGAPPRDAAPGSAYEPDWLADQLRADLARDDRAGLLERFMRTVIHFDDAAMAAFRASPVWPLRVAAAPTILRELEASNDPLAGLEALGAVRVPVLQVVGTASPPAFTANASALAARLANGRMVAIDGAAHAAHHTHPAVFAAAIEAFLDERHPDQWHPPVA